MASEWIKHVQATYRANKTKNKFYQYKQAMKDAKKTFHKGSNVSVKRSKKRSNKTRRRK